MNWVTGQSKKRKYEQHETVRELLWREQVERESSQPAPDLSGGAVGAIALLLTLLTIAFIVVRRFL